MFLRCKSRFSTKNIVKLDLKNIIDKDKSSFDPSNLLKYYIPIPSIVFEKSPNIDVTSCGYTQKLAIAKPRKVDC